MNEGEAYQLNQLLEKRKGLEKLGLYPRLCLSENELLIDLLIKQNNSPVSAQAEGEVSQPTPMDNDVDDFGPTGGSAEALSKTET